MKVTIDSNVSLKKHLTFEEVLLALAIRRIDLQATLENMVNRGVLVKDDEGYHLTQHWSDVVDEVILDSAGAVDNEERLTNLAKEMQKLFPAGKMPGTPYYYKCNVREITLKLKKFFAVHGNYTDEQILDATKRFVSSFNGSYKYMPLIKYFITKNKTVQDEDGTNHVVEESQLATFLENKEDSNTVTASDDWLLNARN